MQWSTRLLGVLLVAEGVGKLADVPGYALALGNLDALPRSLVPVVAVAWLSAEVLAGVSLLFGRRALGAAVVALVLQLGYAALTASAVGRGLTVDNCTCFGVFLRQRPSPFVLLQDAGMIAWAASVVAHQARPVALAMHS